MPRDRQSHWIPACAGLTGRCALAYSAGTMLATRYTARLSVAAARRMHPALSVLFFTTLSGAGYGLWFLLGLELSAVWPHCPEGPHPGRLCVWPPHHWQLLVGLALTTTGLLSSMAHLGQPQRAWRAFSQWHSSWLSREGIAAVLTAIPALALLLNTIWPWLWDEAMLRVLGMLLMFGCIVTVFCTARIYTSLKPIHAWHNRFVLPGYLLLALYSGALWCWTLSVLPFAQATPGERAALTALIAVLAPAAALLKFFYWRYIDTTSGPPTPESATGLGAFGQVKSFECPHTEDNYLTREMGFVVARKHGDTLRNLALACAFALPLLLQIVAQAWPAANPWCALAALLAGSLGIFVERWLFFAQARHTVMLYYGAASA